MCITLDKASLSKTKILSIPVGNGNHFISYSNSVRNTSGKPNALLLPILGKTKKEWFYDTSEYKGFMKEILKKSRYNEDYMGMRTRSKSLRSSTLSVEEFTLGNYRIILADNLLDVLYRVDALLDDEKPYLSDELIGFFKNEEYSKCSFALCLFDSDKTIDAQPIAFEYTPLDPNLIYFPTIDSHDGGAPKRGEMVKTDHTFIYEHTGPQEADLAKTSVELSASVPEFLKNRRYRFKESRGLAPNGDTFIGVGEMRRTPFANTPEITRGILTKSEEYFSIG